jgi:adenylate cyclase
MIHSVGRRLGRVNFYRSLAISRYPFGMSIRDEDRLKGDAARLWQLIDERTLPGADIRRIDERIWNLFGHDLAVMFTDLTGFSRRVAAFGIIHFLQEIHLQKRTLLPIVDQHDGILLKIEADSFLIIFGRIDLAMRCAVSMQHACQALNASRAPEDQVLLCIGLGHGRVLRIGDEDVFGAEVNAASKLGEDVARANEILVTALARTALEGCQPAVDDLQLAFSPLEAQIPGSERCYRVGYAPAKP